MIHHEPLPENRQRLISWTHVSLLLIVLLALGLRLHGLNWDSGYGFHPDERDIYMRAGCMYEALTDEPGYLTCGYLNDQPETVPGFPGIGVFLDRERSPLNPHWFPLGSILVYLMVFIRSIVELFTDISALDMRYVGRTIAALADVGSVLMVFVLGRRLYGSTVALLAAALTATAVIHVQNSHYFRPETLSVLFTLVSFWAMLRMVDRKGVRDSLILGLALGLTLAPKISGLPLVLPLVLAYGYRLWDVRRTLSTQSGEGVEPRPYDWAAMGRVVGHGAMAAAVSATVFLITSPYSLLDFHSFISDVAAQGNMASHAGLWPFTVQYIGTDPFIYQFRQSAIFGLGLPLGIIAWLAIPFTAVLSFWPRENRRADLLILVWLVASLLFLESFEVRFLRYVFPLMPFMILLGSRMLIWLAITGRWAGWKQHRSPDSGHLDSMRPLVLGNVNLVPVLTWMPIVLILVVLVSTVFYTLAFQRVYALEHPAVRASIWINQNVPQGTGIVSDNHWDEYVPNLYRYDVWQYPMYEAEIPTKMETLAKKLADSEYLVFYSNRPYTSVSRAPRRFPFSTTYHRKLFGGELGYRLEKTFTSYPRLFGVEFRDEPLTSAGLPEVPGVDSNGAVVSFNLGYADDNVTGYDHPRVLLFRNVEDLSAVQLLDELIRPSQPQTVADGVGLMLSEDAKKMQSNGGTWSQVIDRDSWTNRVPVLAWLVAVELVYLVSLPLAMFLFRPLPDHGIVFARILGILAVAYLTWIIVSLGWVGFSITAIVIGFFGLVVMSAIALLARWNEIRDRISRNWRMLLSVETLFLVAFLAFAVLRAANPDLWHPWRGGEKPMELAYFNAVIRSTSMPPFDPWFAGGYLNYYYWGYFIPAILVRVTGILPATAFNLAVPLFFALTLTGTYSLVYNLTEGVRRSRHDSLGLTGQRYSGKDQWLRLGLNSPVGAGLLGGMFVGLIGNLDGIVQAVQGGWYKAHNMSLDFPAFDFWRSSRMIPYLENFDPLPPLFWVPDKIADTPDMSPHITEFPFFTFLFADLHAHMMAIPFTILVIALGLNMVVGLRREGRLWMLSASMALALALGALWVVNSWDYPPYVLLVVVLTALAVYFRPGTARIKVFLFVFLVAGMVALSLVTFWPFHHNYEAFNTGLGVSKWRTPIDRYLGIHGLFLFSTAAFLIVQNAVQLGQLLNGPGGRNWADRAPRCLLALGLVAMALLLVVHYWTAVMLMGLLTLTALTFWSALSSGRRERIYETVPLVLLGMALAMSLGIDFVRIEGDIGRMNTLFKYYLEIWVLFSIVSAYMVWRVISDKSPVPVHMGAGKIMPQRRWVWIKSVWLGVLVFLVVGSLIYTVMGTKDRLADRFNAIPMTLDGTAYMVNAVHGEDGQTLPLGPDRDAIRWLQDNLDGSPVVLEAHGEQYHWNARISSYTGLPTVLGWPWHQIQQRQGYRDQIAQRAADVAEIYNTADPEKAQELLNRYDIAYVILGELERIYYNQAGLSKFPEMARLKLLQQVYSRNGVVIYRTSTQ